MYLLSHLFQHFLEWLFKFMFLEFYFGPGVSSDWFLHLLVIESSYWHVLIIYLSESHVFKFQNYPSTRDITLVVKSNRKYWCFQHYFILDNSVRVIWKPNLLLIYKLGQKYQVPSGLYPKDKNLEIKWSTLTSRSNLTTEWKICYFFSEHYFYLYPKTNLRG